RSIDCIDLPAGIRLRVTALITVVRRRHFIAARHSVPVKLSDQRLSIDSPPDARQRSRVQHGAYHAVSPASASLTPGWNEPKITPRASELLRSPRWLRPDRDVRLASKPLPEVRARRRRERTASAQSQEPPPLDIRECRALASRSRVASGDRL